jgi:hypothetical protein
MERIVSLDRARTFITFLVVLYHSVINYTYFGIGGDRMRWLGFDLVVLFDDSFFMACMFLISGLFVHDSLARRGSANFLSRRAWRLGIPYLVSIFVLMPIAYFRYQFPGATDFNFFHFWWHMLTIGPWPPGPAWFLWLLLTFDAIAALLWAVAPRAIEALGQRVDALRERPMIAFAAFLVFSIIIYLPLRLKFGDSSLVRARPLSAHLSDQPYSALCRLFLCRCLCWRGRVERRSACGERRDRKALDGVARLRACFLWRHPASGLCAPQLDRGFQVAAALVAHGLWSLLCDVLRLDDVDYPCGFLALCAIAALAARHDAALGLRHLSLALYSADLAAIPRLRSSLPGFRQIRDCVRRHAFNKLGAYRPAAKDFRSGAHDLRRDPINPDWSADVRFVRIPD